MTIEEVLSHPKNFQYMLMSRLETDLERPGRLWGIDIKTHMEYLTALYDALEVPLSRRKSRHP